MLFDTNLIDSLIFMTKNAYTQMLIILICFDFLTGYLKSIMWHVTDSWVGLKGIAKHLITFMFYFLLGAFMHFLGDFGLSKMFLIIICLNYVLSIFENLGVMGVYVPKFLKAKVVDEMKRYNSKLENVHQIDTNKEDKTND